MKTKTERIMEWFTNQGYTLVTDYPTRKYKVLRREGRNGFVFVGKNAAVRVGKTVTDSISFSHKFARI